MGHCGAGVNEKFYKKYKDMISQKCESYKDQV